MESSAVRTRPFLEGAPTETDTRSVHQPWLLAFSPPASEQVGPYVFGLNLRQKLGLVAFRVCTV